MDKIVQQLSFIKVTCDLPSPLQIYGLPGIWIDLCLTAMV
jgi:hypothetical protein